MKLETFQQYMSGKGFKVVRNAACGVEEEYPVVVTRRQQNLWDIAFTVKTDQWKMFQKPLKTALKGLGSPRLLYGKLYISLKVYDASYQQNYGAAVQQTIGILRQFGVLPIEECAICKRGGCDSLILHGDLYHPVHDGCCDQILHQTKQEAEQNELNGNYVLGFIGGLLGAVVGVIPSVLTILLADRIYAILFALIPMCIYFGYKLFGGKLNKVALVTSIVLSIVGVMIMELMLTSIYISTEFGTGITESVSLMFASLAMPDMWSAIAADSIMPLIFAGLGVWISWGYISRTSQSTVRSIEERISTKIPYSRQDAVYSETVSR
ncbi:hypothetical protein [Candidatus Soleaferrea massiliensis]|uniref:hypothetical protein n=1 Tax=Candidatus Soleaferrea massiliensis TaxID=1470354 RepID=UPI00058DBD4D|nr:hypothetical protein [Candidatus Soleaferrea massiliensis]